MAHITGYSGYSGYLIDAAQLAKLSTTVATIDTYANVELDAANFVTGLKALIVSAKAAGASGANTTAFLGKFDEMLVKTKISAADLAVIRTAITTLNKYKDDTTRPSAMANARSVIIGLADTLNQVTPAMMYSAMMT